MATTLNTGLEIAEDLVDRLPIKEVTVSAMVKRMILRAYFEILEYHPWSWLIKHPPGVINVPDAISDTITATVNSASATITSPAVTKSLVGWKVQHKVNMKIYRILTHVTTTITLDATWNEDSCTTEACYIYQDEFSLATACLTPVSFYDRTNSREIDFISADELKTESGNDGYGNTSADMKVSLIADKKVRIKPWQLDKFTIEYEYTVDQDDLSFLASTPAEIVADTPNIPKHFRWLIADKAMLLLIPEWDNTPNVNVKIAKLQASVNEGLLKLIDRDRNRVPYSMDLSA